MSIIIQEHTTKNPITLIGEEAGCCWGADTTNQKKNYKRGLDCLKLNHGRTLEFPQVYFIANNYSAKCIRELYTHIGGSPTRLQASTRYIDYSDFPCVIPPTISKEPERLEVFNKLINETRITIQTLKELGVPNEDATMALPLCMETKMVERTNLRNLIDMAHQRKCARAYWEFRVLFSDLEKALSEYSEEWEYIVKNYFKPKCDVLGYCSEKKSCGRNKKKEG